MKDNTTEKLPVVGEVYSKRTRFLQDWVVTDVYKSHVDGVTYVRLQNPLMGEKNVGAAELVRRRSDWSKKTVEKPQGDALMEISIDSRNLNCAITPKR